jgi:enoyl-CoA hydratase/carnithine racemase
MTVNLDIDGAIAAGTIAKPPVNPINRAVRKRLLALTQKFDGKPSIRAIVLTCAGTFLVARGDITEFARHPQFSVETKRMVPLLGPQTHMASEAIVARLMTAMAQEGQPILKEGIAASAAYIDLVEVHGYGFS